MEFCSNCLKDAEVVLDRRSGDAICTACGLILGSCYIQTRPVVQEPCIIDDERESKDLIDDDEDDVIVDESEFKGVSDDDGDDFVADSSDVTSDDVQAEAEADGPIPQEYWVSLDLHAEDVKAISGTLAKLEELGIRCSPKDVAAAVVYMIGQLCNDKLTLEAVSKAADVEKWEIEETYEDLYYFASRVIPQWYQKLKDITKLCTP